MWLIIWLCGNFVVKNMKWSEERMQSQCTAEANFDKWVISLQAKHAILQRTYNVSHFCEIFGQCRILAVTCVSQSIHFNVTFFFTHSFCSIADGIMKTDSFGSVSNWTCLEDWGGIWLDEHLVHWRTRRKHTTTKITWELWRPWEWTAAPHTHTHRLTRANTHTIILNSV